MLAASSWKIVEVLYELNPYFQISGAWARPIYGKLIQIWNGPAHAPEIENSKMDEFSRNTYYLTPWKTENLKKKIFGWLFQDLTIRVNYFGALQIFTSCTLSSCLQRFVSHSEPMKAFYLSLSVSICYQLSRQSNSNPDFDLMGIKKSFGFSPKIRSGSINNAKLETVQEFFSQNI